MTTFLDGPAKGQHLMLRRRVRFLRVVVSERGVWDALDQVSDSPSVSEKLYAYEAHGEGGMCHIRSSKKGSGGFYPMQDYKFVVEQPDDATMRDVVKWVAWVEARAVRLGLK